MPKYKITKRTRTGGTKFVDTIYFEPSPKTYASAVLLKDYYEQRDADFISSIEYRMRKIAFSRNFLRRELKIKKNLCCSYCNKSNLRIEFNNMNVPNEIKATIDHVIPISAGGDIFSVNNVVVACGKCNTKKGSQPLEEFLSTHAVYLKEKREKFANKKFNGYRK